jgi:hypothetical protein
MTRKLPRLLLISICITLIFIMACSSTEGQGGNATEPSITAPEIVDGFMCTAIYDNNPVGIDNDFFVNDEIFIWLSWKNVLGAHNVKIVWVDPNDKLYETPDGFTSQDGHMTTYFWLDTTNSAPTGRWLAEVYIDGVFMRSYAFWLNSLS